MDLGQKRFQSLIVRITEYLFRCSAGHHFSVFQKNKQGISISSSISANVRKVTKSTYELSYMYSNIPQQQDDTLHIHTGVAIITFDLKHKTADGIYYTDINRKSYGTMKLIRQ